MDVPHPRQMLADVMRAEKPMDDCGREVQSQLPCPEYCVVRSHVAMTLRCANVHRRWRTT